MLEKVPPSYPLGASFIEGYRRQVQADPEVGFGWAGEERRAKVRNFQAIIKRDQRISNKGHSQKRYRLADVTIGPPREDKKALETPVKQKTKCERESTAAI